jgi:hypothetical protein
VTNDRLMALPYVSDHRVNDDSLLAAGVTFPKQNVLVEHFEPFCSDTYD